jgi:hypothetical protein
MSIDWKDKKYDVSNIIRLLNQCASNFISCDECKWDTRGFCYSEEAYRLINQIPIDIYKRIPLEDRSKLDHYKVIKD